MDNEQSVEEFLEHYGVPGMRWGHRNASVTVNSGPSRKELKSLDKASAAKDRQERNSQIDAARKRYYGGDARNNYLKAKAQYQIDKKTIGKREAAKAFNKVKEKNIADYELASQTKSGAETAAQIIGVIGTVAISVALQAAAKKYQ